MHIKIVAGLGTSSVAAVTTGHRVFFFVQAILMGLSVATTALVARNWGAREIARAEMVSWTAIALAILTSAILSIPVLMAPEAIAGLFGLDIETTLKAASFIFWLGLFNIPSAVNMILSTSLRATGDVITPLWFLFFSSALNVLFAYLLAFGVGPLPQWGVTGVALGGGSAGLIITVLFVLFWWRGRFGLKPARSTAVDRRVVRQLLTIGAPSMLEQGVIQLSFLLFFGIVARYGTSAYAAYGIGISLVSFSVVIGFGFGIAASTLVGQYLGAGEPVLARMAGWRALRMGVGAMCLMSILIALFAQDLAAFMIDDPEVISYTTAFLYMIAISQPLMACEITLGGALRGAGDTRFPLVATFCGLVFGRLLPAWLFASLGLSVYWIFAVMILDNSIKSLLALYRYRSGKWLNITTFRHSALTTVDSDKKNT